VGPFTVVENVKNAVFNCSYKKSINLNFGPLIQSETQVMIGFHQLKIPFKLS
jgi:hypothetical protein